MSKECAICDSTDTKKCKCGGYYCKPHMTFHTNNFCKFGKKGAKIAKEEEDEK
jgi:hypothetical protein